MGLEGIVMSETNSKPPIRYIGRRELLARVPLSYPSIWKKTRQGEFPKPRVLGGRNAWDESAVDAFLAALPERQYLGTAKSIEPKFTEDKRKRLRRRKAVSTGK